MRNHNVMVLFFFFFQGGIIIQINIIYNFDDLKTILKDKTKKGSYYLLKDDIYFEEIFADTVISRYVFLETKKMLNPSSIIKYISFKTKENYSTKQIYELVQLLKYDAEIIVTIFSPKDKECNLLFISDEDNISLENHIIDILQMEVL